jgi:hypothetical protein
MLATWPLPIAELSVTYAIDGPLDVPAFRVALGAVVADHEQLRLRRRSRLPTARSHDLRRLLTV